VSDFIGGDTDDCERIVDGVRAGVPPTKEVGIIWAAVESLGAEYVLKISRDEASRLLDIWDELLVLINLHCSAAELLHWLVWYQR